MSFGFHSGKFIVLNSNKRNIFELFEGAFEPEHMWDEMVTFFGGLSLAEKMGIDYKGL